MRRSVIAILAVGLVAIGAGVAVVLLHRPLVAVANNSIAGQHYIELEEEKHRLSNCQPAGVVPRGTSAVRIGIEGIYYSPPVRMQVLVGSRIVREATRRGGGPPAPNVTVGVASFAHSVQNARICLAVGPMLGVVRYYGVPNPSAAGSKNALGQAELHIEYLRPGPDTWWSLASSITLHLGFGRAPSGGWVAFLIIALMLGLTVGVSRLVIEELR